MTAALLALLVATGDAAAPRSPAIYPPQEIALRFSHRPHLATEARCLPCHAEATRSTSTGDRLIPPEARCAGCHDIEGAKAGKPTAPPSACPACHPGFDFSVQPAPRASAFPRAALRFSHAAHLARLAGAASPTPAQCETCHGAFAQVELATRQQLPAMATCLECHDGRGASRDCALCHLPSLAAKGALIETDLPGGRLVPGRGDPLGLDHGPAFAQAHALVALGHRGECAACHPQASCDGCHRGTTKPQAIHPGDYVNLHAVQARVDSPRCGACHRRQSFCAACHERIGIGPEADPAFQRPGVRVHPPTEVWVGKPAGAGISNPNPQHHSIQAARNIGQCASCHREEQCLECHSARGSRVHPPDFRQRCQSLFRKNARACEKCHTPSDPSDSAAVCR